MAGSSALGNVSLRYYADVDPLRGDFFSSTFLGGAVLTGYLGGELNHRFFTEEGKGTFDLAYTPSFITSRETGTRSEELYKVRFQYDTEQTLDISQLNFLISRDDELQNRIAEFTLRMENSISGIKGVFSAKNFIDFEPEDEVINPSFGSPFRSLELTLTPEGENAEQVSYSIGPFTATGISLNLGFFEALSNSSNRSAAIRRKQLAGRLVETHTINLSPLSPWAGLEIAGNTGFRGQYYTTGERLVNWNSNLNATQSFGSLGSFRLSFDRNINEGETPFAFDTQNLGNTSFLSGNLDLTPFDWLSFSSNTRYTFLDDRNVNAEGFAPIESRLSLFNNLTALNLTISNSYDIKEEDPGNLRYELSLRSLDPSVDASLTATFIDDLNPNIPDRLDQVKDETELDISLTFGVRPYLTFDMSGGYIFDPPEPAEGDPLAYRKDLQLGLTFGTEDQFDLIPSLRLGLTRDLNKLETKTLDISATAAVQPVEASLEQSFNYQTNSIGESNYRIRWRNIALLEASGFALIPASFVGLELAEDRREDWRFSLAEDREDGEARWRIVYNTTRIYGNFTGSSLCRREETDPNPKSCNSNIESFINLDETRIGAFYFGVNFNSTLILRDDSQPLTYFSDARLEFFTDIASIVGLQGTLQYTGRTSDTALTESRLQLTNVALTARFFEELYLSMILNETWQLGTETLEAEFNFQPEFRLTWDRCCWALYSSWNSKTGTISITLTTPGATEGLGGVFEETPLRLPGGNDTNSGT